MDIVESKVQTAAQTADGRLAAPAAPPVVPKAPAFDPNDKVARAKRMGELADKIERLRLNVLLAKAGQENKAWIVHLQALDEGESERSIPMQVLPYKQMVQSVQNDDGTFSPRPERVAITELSRKIFAIVQEDFEAQLAAAEAELEAL